MAGSKLQNPKDLFGCFLVNIILVIFSFSFLPSNSVAGEILLEWDLDDDPNIAGYIVYWGTTSRIYSDSVDVGKHNDFAISGLDDGRSYYFSVTAYDWVRNESGFSSEVYSVVTLIDSDKDGLSDSDEINIYATNPLSADTDGDGTFDGMEILYESDPLDVQSIPYCAADYDRNGDVGGTDMTRFMAEYGGTTCRNDCNGDFDGDGDVDGKDLTLFIKFYGNSGCP